MDTLQPFIVAVLTAFIIAGIPLLLRRSKPLSLGASSGTIRPERWTAWFTVVGGAAMCVGGVAVVIFYVEQRWAGAALALMGAAVGGFMLPSVTSLHAVQWDENGIEGPSKTFGPTLGVARTKIAWAEVVTTGSTLTDYKYVQAADGRRVYWSYLYKGHGVFEEVIAQRAGLSV